jgi:signal transduction histidine kinase
LGGAQFDGRELKGFQVYVSSLADVTVLETPAVEAFAKPVRLGRDLVGYSSLGAGEHRAHVQGAVTMQRPGGLLFIRDPSGGIYLQTFQAPFFKLGERVDAVGFKPPGSLTPRLQSAVVRSRGVGEPLKPVPISAVQAMSGKFNYELVQMEARLLQAQAPTHEQLCLLLEAGEHSGTACLHGTNLAALASSLHPQSLLRLTGVCQIVDTAARPRPELTLWLRSPSDIQVLMVPRVSHGGGVAWTLWSLGLMLVAAAIPLAWMRRRARRQVEQALAESQRRLRGHVEERERISQDLHDNIMQSIYAVGLGLEGCRRLVQKAPAQAEERLAIAIRALNSVIQDVRQFIGGLEPRVLSGSELKTALKSLALTTGDSSSQVVIQVDPNATHHLTSQQATHLLNIAKEAMSNSLRHASATQTVVALRLEQGHVLLEVADDGCGFDPKDYHEGNGLRNVAARARELGARQEIISAPNKGTRVIVDLPPLSIDESRSTT